MGQDKECCLERVLGILAVTEYAVADAEDHRPVALHQGFERGF